MVWVVEGSIHNDPEDELNAEPQITAHYLRPNRHYRCGRAPYTVTTGQGDQISRPRPFDFRIKSSCISKTGAFSLVTGDWDPLDDESKSDNLKPYKITISGSSKPISLQRARAPIVIVAESTYELLDHDEVIICKRATGKPEIKFKVSWIPICLCISRANPSYKAKYEPNAKDIGVKIAYSELRLHHTHHVRKEVVWNVASLISMINQTSLVTSDYFEELLVRTQLKSKPAGLEINFWPLQEPPTDLSDLDLKKWTRDAEASFQNILSLEPSVGYDLKRYWGHSVMEDDWRNRPIEAEYLTAISTHKGNAGFGKYKNEVLLPNPLRRNIFREILVVSVGDDLELDKIARQLVTAAEGRFLSLGVPPNDSTGKSLLATINTHRHQEKMNASTRVILLVEAEYTLEVQAKETESAKALRELAFLLKISRYAEGVDLYKCIIDAEVSSLLSLPFDSSNHPGSTALQRSSPTATAPSSTPGGTFQTVPGTNPEEYTIMPRHPYGGNFGTLSRLDTSRTTRRRGPAPAIAAPVGEENMLRAANRESTQDPESGSQTYGFEGSTTQLSSLRAKRRRVGPAPMPGPVIPPVEEEGWTRRSSPALEIDNIADRSEPEPHHEHDHRRPARVAGRTLLPFESEVENNEGSKMDLVPRKRVASSAAGPGQEEDVFQTGASTGKRTRLHAETGNTVDGMQQARIAMVHQEESTFPAVIEKRANNKEVDEHNLLKMKTSRRKGAQIDQGFNEDFNALKIVKPAFAPMRSRKAERVGWGEEDLEEEELRRGREEQDFQNDHPDNWGGHGKSCFVIEIMPMVKKHRSLPRQDLVVDGKYAGRPNFKKFKPKGSHVGDTPSLARSHERPKLVLEEKPDFGLGPGYGGRRRKKPTISLSMSREQTADDSMSDFENNAGNSKSRMTKKASKPPARSQRMRQTLVSDSDHHSDSQQGSDGSFENYIGRNDDMEIDKWDSDDRHPNTASTGLKMGNGRSAPSTGRANASSSTTTSKSLPQGRATRAPATRRPRATVMLANDSDDSDSGLTFKGFGDMQQRRQ